MASVIEEKKRISNSPPRSISASAATLNPLIAPPPRSDSLNHAYHAVPSSYEPRVIVTNIPNYSSVPLSATVPVSVVVPASFDKSPPRAGLKKEKTKSRVWGLLGKKAGKSKECKEDETVRRDSAGSGELIV